MQQELKMTLAQGPGLIVLIPAMKALLDESTSDSFKVSYLTNH